ncbi:hypothetical protein EPK99_23655 [Neorhizobium lilium]|uniref:Uncharacterized protein n=1 Tax=Neorhizobium lilium TaxID=2503024 RepID=A0A444LB88_9HYPH|nr:hypothetical protein [Neorhizobium lilium]RWX74884.1 hypothetical protein EPK99_23655 [Neorhizobium lilium]
MKTLTTAIILFAFSAPSIGFAQSPSSIVPVLKGAYAPASGGCDAAAAAFVYIEDKDIGANKTAGKVKSVKHEGNSYVLDVLWVEAGSDETDGDRDTVVIEVKDTRSFIFSNTTSKRTLMRWCN